MISNYVVWKTKEVPNAFVLDILSGIEKPWEVVKGVPRASNFPNDVSFSVDPDYPNHTLLIDAFETTRSMTVISPKLKDFLEVRHPKNLEFLPVTIFDHKKKPAGRYFILHPIHPVDCLDLKASEVKWNPVDSTKIGKIKHIVFDGPRLDHELIIFKFKYLYDKIIVRRDLARDIDTAGFTGVQWTELESFKR